MLNKLMLVILIIAALAYLKVDFAVDIVESLKPFWNNALSFMVNFRENYPWLYLPEIPFALLILMKGRKRIARV